MRSGRSRIRTGWGIEGLQTLPSLLLLLFIKKEYWLL